MLWQQPVDIPGDGEDRGIDFAVRHSIPGRVRLHIPLLYHKTPLTQSVETWLKSQDGIETVRVNHACASLVIEYDRARPEIADGITFALKFATLDQLKQLLAEAEANAKPAQAVQQKATSGRFPLALPTLSLLLAFSANPLVQAVNVPLMLWNSVPIAKRAFRVLKNEKRLNVDFLDVLAISASLIQGLHMTGAIIVWLIRLGDWIRDMTAAGSRRAVADLLEYESKTAWILVDGTVLSIPAAQLTEGHLVVVYPGEMIPVDGVVIDGHAIVDQKTITGEGLPVHRTVGDFAFAATIIREGQLTVRAERVGPATTAAQIVRMVEEAPIGDTRMQNHAERFADRLVLPTLGLAGGTAFLTADFNRFLSLIIVDFGTGIRVAAPTSVLSSMTHAARVGIIIKSGCHMERLAEVDTIVFDKTGTLTHGVPSVMDVKSYDTQHFPAERLLALATAAETHLKHPVAEALRAHAAELQLTIPQCNETEYRIGLGVEGEVDGHYMHVGSERFLTQCSVSTAPVARDRRVLDEKGYSCLYVAIDGKLAGIIPYADRIREESREVIRLLHAMGIKNTVMLTGDNAVVARAVGGRIGVSMQHADMLPAHKVEVIRELREKGHIVAMVGDGINDSAALCHADVGIAMKHSAEVTHESAHVMLMEDNLWKLVKAIEISRGAVSLIKQNYGIVAALNIAAMGLALPAGLVSPAFTAVLSNGSAVLASLNGMRPVLRYQ
jgi:Cu2+-exporting ATPase